MMYIISSAIVLYKHTFSSGYIGCYGNDSTNTGMLLLSRRNCLNDTSVFMDGALKTIIGTLSVIVAPVALGCTFISVKFHDLGEIIIIITYYLIAL